MNIRIIPKLDIKNENLVKGVNLEGLRSLGNPKKFAEIYYSKGADELIYHDVVASLYERNSATELIKKTSRNIFLPMLVGGGINNLNEVEDLAKKLETLKKAARKMIDKHRYYFDNMPNLKMSSEMMKKKGIKISKQDKLAFYLQQKRAGIPV